MNADQIIEAGCGYYTDPRQLQDGTWCCLARMMFTTALVVGVTESGYSHRYCYDSVHVALAELLKLTAATYEPTGYIVRK